MVFKDRRLFYVILLAGLFVIIVEFFSYLENPVSNPAALPEAGSQIVNPASSNCKENGGSVEIRENDGGQVGFCVFDDKSECEEWAFWRGNCKKGDKFCKDLCGNGICEEIVCMAAGCPCAETAQICPKDCE